ncbi:MAG: cell wall hydrolase [Oscillospiraceae bacterium]|nr:cell wall hydrolase [Oscillospiraceae bacterium]
MKRIPLALACLMLLTTATQALYSPEDETEKSAVYIQTLLEERPHTEEPTPHAAAPEVRFHTNKQQAAAEQLLPAEARLLPPAPSRWTDYCVTVLARMVWGEGRGVSRNEQKLIVWTVINRLENGRYGTSLIGVVRARGQFHGYSSRHPVTDPIRNMVIEVLEAWERGEAAKVYPPFATTPHYLYFSGRNGHNWFRERHR